MSNTKTTLTHPITGNEVAPADLLAEAQKGTPWNKLTEAEKTEFYGLSPELRKKLADIADAAMIGAAAVDPDNQTVSQDDADEILSQIFSQFATTGGR